MLRCRDTLRLVSGGAERGMIFLEKATLPYNKFVLGDAGLVIFFLTIIF